MTLFGAFVLDVGFLFAFVINPIDYCLTSREAVDYIDVSFVYARMGAAILAAVLAFLGFSLALRPVRDERRMERALAVLAAVLPRLPLPLPFLPLPRCGMTDRVAL